MDGYELCRRVRAEPWGRDMKIAAVTGWARDEDRRRSLEAGFDVHLVKPVTVSVILPLLHGAGSQWGKVSRNDLPAAF